MCFPLSSQSGTHKTVKPRCWPWLPGKGPQTLSKCWLFARERYQFGGHGGETLLSLLALFLDTKRGGNTLNGFPDFRTENGSNKGQNMALTGLIVASWLDSGGSGALASGRQCRWWPRAPRPPCASSLLYTLCFRAKREHFKRFYGLSPDSHGHTLVVTVVYVAYWLGSGMVAWGLEGLTNWAAMDARRSSASLRFFSVFSARHLACPAADCRQAHTRQSRSDSGLGLQVKVLTVFRSLFARKPPATASQSHPTPHHAPARPAPAQGQCWHPIAAMGIGTNRLCVFSACHLACRNPDCHPARKHFGDSTRKDLGHSTRKDLGHPTRKVLGHLTTQPTMCQRSTSTHHPFELKSTVFNPIRDAQGLRGATPQAPSATETAPERQRQRQKPRDRDRDRNRETETETESERERERKRAWEQPRKLGLDSAPAKREQLKRF